MTAAPRDMLESIIIGIDKAPESQVADYVKVEVRDILEIGMSNFSDGELYDVVQRVGDREVDAEISSFMRALCNLARYYTRP